MDRLLSEQEMAEIDNRHTSPSPYGGVILNMINARKECLAAQLAKADKEWVEWAFVICRNPSHSSGYWTKGSKLMQHQPRCECAECWQERKKEIGL
jgi:hypothetical protein